VRERAVLEAVHTAGGAYERADHTVMLPATAALAPAAGRPLDAGVVC
jgi:hypothetical protein